MKVYISILIVILFCGFQSCSPKMQPPNQIQEYSAEVKFLNKEDVGTMSVESNGFGKNLDAAIFSAQQRVFYTILFKGLPGSEQSQALVDNETSSTSEHSDYYKKLFDGNFYQTFMMSSNTVSSSKVKGGITVTIDIKINYDSFRKDLEQNNIIRKFGY